MPVESAGPAGRLLFVFSVVLAVAVLAPPPTSSSSLSATAGDYPPHFGRRIRRQLPPLEQGNQVIDNIFQIPISTLNAVGSLIKSSRPLVRRTRERIQQYYNGGSGGGQQQQLPSAAFSQQQQYNRPSPSNYLSSYGNRPSSTYYNSRKKQQRDDPLPEGRQSLHRSNDEDY